MKIYSGNIIYYDSLKFIISYVENNKFEDIVRDATNMLLYDTHNDSDKFIIFLKKINKFKNNKIKVVQFKDGIKFYKKKIYKDKFLFSIEVLYDIFIIFSYNTLYQRRTNIVDMDICFNLIKTNERNRKLKCLIKNV